MDNSEEILRSETTAEQAQRSIEKTLKEIGIVGYLPQDPLNKVIAILGAGSAVEIGAITSYFLRNGLGKPKIVCFDKDPLFKGTTEKLFGSQDINFEYRIKDITDPSSFENEQYDMVIIRKPEGNTQSWKKAFENGFDHLKTAGIFLATTDVYADFVRDQLRKGGEVVKTYIIPDKDRIGPYFNESDLFVAKKIIK